MSAETNDNGNGFKIDIAHWRGETTQAIRDIKEDLMSVKVDLKANTKELRDLNGKMDTIIKELVDRISDTERELTEKETAYVARFSESLTNLQKYLEENLRKCSTVFQEELDSYKTVIDKRMQALELNHTAETAKRSIINGIIIAIATAVAVLGGQNLVKLIFG